MPSNSNTASRSALANHRVGTLRELFTEDPGRAPKLTFELAGLRIDFSKQRITTKTLELLATYAEERGFSSRRAAMFAGEPINSTEGRAAAHVALRTPAGRHFTIAGRDVVPDVQAVLEKMSRFAKDVREGNWKGVRGDQIRNVVNIGIGGSDLGPAMATQALTAFRHPRLRFHYVANVDSVALAEVLAELNPAETLFIIASKTFTTQETMENARSARAWLTQKLPEPEAVAKHFVAVSTDAHAVKEFGIDPENMFIFWDWVGGRYSLSSAIGLSTMISIGPEGFRELLAGYAAVDSHFQEAPLAHNVPALHGLISLWNSEFQGAASMAVIPYAHELRRFPAYLQQLVMESNGKSVTLDGEPVRGTTSPVIWGEPGTDGQHSFFQLLHQGTAVIPCDFIGFAVSNAPLSEHQDRLFSNLIAQSEALAFGRTPAEVAKSGVSAKLVPHRTFPGNRPSTTIIGERLTPHSLGALVALYEHSVFTQAIVWGINPFDQWGVELGKALATSVYKEFTATGQSHHDSSTQALIAYYRAHRR